MKNILRFEELVMFCLCTYALYLFNVEWWIYILILFAPDISMAGYTINNKAGAFCYNLAHHKGLALLIAAAGFIFHLHGLLVGGIILFGHSSLDRIFGYGLKYTRGFKFTHLGTIGNIRTNQE